MLVIGASLGTFAWVSISAGVIPEPSSFPQPPQPQVGDHPQGDRRREPRADGERLLEHRMPRVELLAPRLEYYDTYLSIDYKSKLC